MHRLIRGLSCWSVVALFSASMVLTLCAPDAVASTVSTFDTTSEGWLSVGFANVSNFPLFPSTVTSSGVTHNAAGGNPGGYISKQDPDGNWQYFSAPSAFLGNQSAAIGLNLTFDELIVSNTQPALNPQGPLVAITNGTLTLVYGGGGSTPPISGNTWNSFVVSLTASSWKVSTPTGAVATTSEFSSVMSSLTGLYILSDFWTGSGANGETLGLDNVNLPTASNVPEPSTISTLLGSLVVLAFWRRSKRN